MASLSCAYCKCKTHVKKNCNKLNLKVKKQLAAAANKKIEDTNNDKNTVLAFEEEVVFNYGPRCCMLCQQGLVHTHPCLDPYVLNGAVCSCCFCVRIHLDYLHFKSFTQECKNRVQLTAEQDGTLFKELVELSRVIGNGLPIINFLLAPTSATLKYGYDNHIYLSAPCYVYGQVLSGIELANKTNGLPSTKDWLSVEVRNQSVAVSN